MEIKTLLNDEIQSEMEELKKLEVGTEQYDTAVNGLTKLIDRTIEMDRLKAEREAKIEDRETEADLRLTQMAEERKDRLVKNCVSVAGIAIPSLLTVWGTLKALKFEETGTVTTMVGRGFINKLFPKK